MRKEQIKYWNLLLLKFEATISRGTTLGFKHTILSSLRPFLTCYGALSNLQTNKRKLESNSFPNNLLPPTLSDCTFLKSGDNKLLRHWHILNELL
jgi:hypothetical protein